MDQFEDRLKQTLRSRSADVRTDPMDTRPVIRRSRVRRTLVSSMVVVAVSLVGFSALQALPRSLGDNEQSVAASPSPSPTYDGAPGTIERRNHPHVECSHGDSDCLPFASGTRYGLSWTMYLFKSEHHLFRPSPREEWCVGLDMNGGGGGGCPAGIPADTHLSLGRSSGDAPSEDVIEGELSKAVSRVEVRIEGYRPFDVPVIPGPQLDAAEDPKVNYFIAFAPTDAKVEVTVYDSSGRELEADEISHVSIPEFRRRMQRMLRTLPKDL